MIAAIMRDWNEDQKFRWQSQDDKIIMNKRV